MTGSKVSISAMTERVGDPPPFATGEEVVIDLFVSSESENKSCQSVFNLEAGQLFGNLAAIVGDDDRLSQGVGFEMLGLCASVFVDIGNGGVEVIRTPTHGEGVAIGRRFSEHCQFNHVLMLRSMGECGTTVDPDKDWHMGSNGCDCLEIVHAIVVVIMLHPLAIKKSAQDLDGLR